MLKAEKELAERGKPGDWAEELLEAMDRWAIKEGMEPVSEQVRADALGSEPGLEAAARQPVEEIATLRLVLRKAFGRALEVEETREYIRVVELYSSGSLRLARLLKIARVDSSKLEALLREEINAAIREVMQGFGWG